MAGCIFCQVVARDLPTPLTFEDEHCVAFEDINKKAPVHMLVIPRRHIVSLNDDPKDEAVLGHLIAVAARVAREKGIDGSGFRVVINTNAEAGQSVFHLHVHVMGGRVMHWPPG